ncbi:hypothetical protein M0R45_020330 [Rubus argutus]|uniref:Uncharacterized protein n=1 Tax=Rubus argutus TaxID=59490 RepID=A0AAW1XBF7_RUBAR
MTKKNKNLEEVKADGQDGDHVEVTVTDVVGGHVKMEDLSLMWLSLLQKSKVRLSRLQLQFSVRFDQLNLQYQFLIKEVEDKHQYVPNFHVLTDHEEVPIILYPMMQNAPPS